MGRFGIVGVLIVAVVATTADAQSGRGSSRSRAQAKKGTVGPASTRAIVIDHASIAGAAQVTPATREKLSRTAFYFAHASVGGNMLSGLDALNKENPQRYPLVARSAGKGPEGRFEGGVVYQDDRGNPGWRGKVDHFRKRVDEAWNGPGLVVLDKFCYIDPDADAGVYLQSMSDLERRHPDTVVVYATVPLVGGEDRNNVKRQAFNEQVRRFVRERGGVLFDIADIEAHDPAGRPRVFGADATPALYDAYTNDGGHLNAEGARRVALGFYALAAELAQRDAR
jgi:hypothetical protein